MIRILIIGHDKYIKTRKNSKYIKINDRIEHIMTKAGNYLQTILYKYVSCSII